MPDIPRIRAGQRIEVDQTRVVLDNGEPAFFVVITDEFINGQGIRLRDGISINTNPNLDVGNIGPTHRENHFSIGGIHDPENAYEEFPPEQQVHYGFIRQLPYRSLASEYPEFAGIELEENNFYGGRYARRGKTNRKTKSKKTIKTRKCNGRKSNGRKSNGRKSNGRRR